MEIKVERLGNVSFIVKTRGHMVISDQPQYKGGSDVGMTPPELMLAALGSCVGYYAAQFLDARNLPAENVEVVVEGEVVPNPGRIGKISIRLAAPASVDEKHLEALERTIRHCTIHNTLTHPPEIQVLIETPVAVAV